MNAVTRKVGPLPVWAYAVILGGTFLALRLLRGGNQQDASVQLIPTGAPPIDASQGFIEDLSLRLDRIESGMTAPPPASSQGNETISPAKFGFKTWEELKAALAKLKAPAYTPLPTTKPTPKPISAKPTGQVSRARAAEIIRKYGGDPAAVFGYGTNKRASSFWLNNPAAAYVWKSEASFEAWAKRTF